jgi:MFS family permease
VSGRFSNIVLKPNQLLVLLTGFNLLNYLDRYMLSALLEPIKKEFQLTDGQAGRISTAFMLGYFLISPIFGYFGDRMSRKWLIAGGVFVWSFATLLSGFATGLVSMLVYRVIVGFGEASYGTISPALITDVYPTEKRNNALTIFYVAIPVGSAIGYLVGGYVSTHWGWREAFYFAGIPGMLLALIFIPFKEIPRGQADDLNKSAQKIPSFGDIMSILKIPKYVLVVAGYCAYTFALGAYAYWGPTFLERVHKMGHGQAATFFGGITVFSGLFATLIGGFFATRLRKKFKNAYAYVLGFSSLGTVPFSFLAFTSDNPSDVRIYMLISVFLFFLPTGPINTLILEAVPANLRASAMAISIFSIHMFGDMWSPEIVGHLSDAWGGLNHSMMILPVFSGLGGLIWLMLSLEEKWTSRRLVH